MDQQDAGRQNAEDNQKAAPEKTMLDVLDLPDDERKAVQWLLRQSGSTAGEVAEHLEITEAAACAMLETLNVQGFVAVTSESDGTHWRAQLASKRATATPRDPRRAVRDVWKALDE